MATATEFGSLAVAGFVAVATFVVSRRALSEFTTLGPPTVIAACVAGLAFFGLLPVASVILVPFAALALTIGLVLILRGLAWLGLLNRIAPNLPPSIREVLNGSQSPLTSTPTDEPRAADRASSPAQPQRPPPEPDRPRPPSSEKKPRIIPLSIKPRSARSSKSGPPRS